MANQTPSPGPVKLLVLQPTPFCNLDCTYCYLPNRNSKARMDWGTLELAINRVLASRYIDGDFTVVWHAGEPLVLPVEWYEEAFGRINAINPGPTIINHNIQTNGVLIDESWIDLFRRHNVRLGLSLDGPAWLHDAHRKTRTGANTHRRVMKAVAQLNRKGFDYHIICVLTSAAMNCAAEIHEFFRANGIRSVGFNVEEIEGCNTNSSLLRTEMFRAYREFMHQMLELSKLHGTPQIRELVTAANVILDRDFAASSNFQTAPLRILSIGVNGDICTFSPELLGNKNERYHDFVIGNVKTHSLDDVLIDDNFRHIFEEIQSGVAKCRSSCAYFVTCGGGAPANKVFEKGRFDVTETMFCQLTCQIPVDVVLSDLEVEFGLRN